MFTEEFQRLFLLMLQMLDGVILDLMRTINHNLPVCSIAVAPLGAHGDLVIFLNDMLSPTCSPLRFLLRNQALRNSSLRPYDLAQS